MDNCSNFVDFMGIRVFRFQRRQSDTYFVGGGASCCAVARDSRAQAALEIEQFEVED